MTLEFLLSHFSGPRLHFNHRAVDCSRMAFGPRGQLAWDVNLARVQKEVNANRDIAKLMMMAPSLLVVSGTSEYQFINGRAI